MCGMNRIVKKQYERSGDGVQMVYAIFAQNSTLPFTLEQLMEGQVLLVNKPLEWTSFDVIKKIRVSAGISKVGHAGTLDPLATGLLIVCTGKFTKKINEYMGMEKEYTGSFTLGAITPTYDLESEPVEIRPYEHITLEDMERVLPQFTGAIQQVPPIHSAIKKDGKPAYIMARKGIDVKLEPRTITIHAFEITAKDRKSVV